MAEWARRIEGEFIPSDRPNENIFLFRKPIGVVAGILPWNFPFFLIARKVAPVLIVGNTVVIEPSEETPNNAFEFADVVDEIGLLPGVFNLVFGRGQTTRRALSESAQIDMISFTGSVETGSKIMAAAAKNITKIKLELGGKAPAIVMPDAILIWPSKRSGNHESSTAARSAIAQSVSMFTKISQHVLQNVCGNRSSAIHWSIQISITVP